MAVFMNNICRLCMTRKDSLVSLFSEDESREQALSIPEKIMNLAPIIKVFAGDGMPSQVCQQCIRLLNASHKFKMQCEAVDATLKQFIAAHAAQENSEDILHSIFRNDLSEEKWKITSVKNEMENSEDDEDDKYQDDSDFPPEPQENLWPSNNNEVKMEGEAEPVEEKKDEVTVKQEETKVKKKPTKKTNISSAEKTSTTKSREAGEPNKAKGQPKAPKPKKVITCPDCGKTFAQKHQMVLHATTHSGIKPFECTTCGKKFARRRQLTVHSFTHTGEKPFLCTVCGESFGRSDTLTKHMRSHTGEKPFHCAVCGNSFGRRSTLTNHMRAHMGEKPYLCTQCGWRFVQSYDLVKHMRSHSKEKPFVCKICLMSFGQRNSLTKHMRSHTNGASPPSVNMAIGSAGSASFPFQITRELQYKNFAPSVLNDPKNCGALALNSLSSSVHLNEANSCNPMTLNDSNNCNLLMLK